MESNGGEAKPQNGQATPSRPVTPSTRGKGKGKGGRGRQLSDFPAQPPSAAVSPGLSDLTIGSFASGVITNVRETFGFLRYPGPSNAARLYFRGPRRVMALSIFGRFEINCKVEERPCAALERARLSASAAARWGSFRLCTCFEDFVEPWLWIRQRAGAIHELILEVTFAQE